FTKVFWGLVRTPPERRDQAVIEEDKSRSIKAAAILDSELSRHAYVAGDSFSMGDIPLGVFIRRFRELIPDRPALPNLERWYSLIQARPAFAAHVTAVPLT
ncbi:MAG TPA: glutathione binding-like protein, partial [Xanthobacteraceae bacterium]|nr:glutathione binding-like protein [Xanthobacteraceae bacterium]